MNYREDEAFAEFLEYNDIGLPLAYCIYSEIVDATPRADLYLSETFDMLLAALNLEDTGFDGLEQMLDKSATYNN